MNAFSAEINRVVEDVRQHHLSRDARSQASATTILI
jgi:hypothetical protein